MAENRAIVPSNYLEVRLQVLHARLVLRVVELSRFELEARDNTEAKFRIHLSFRVWEPFQLAEVNMKLYLHCDGKEKVQVVLVRHEMRRMKYCLTFIY